MPKIMRRCKDCGRYTMRPGEECPDCGSGNVHSVYPPKFSLEDKYGKYRRAMKARLEATSPGQEPGA